MKTAKTIQLLLNDNDLEGVVAVRDSQWFSGELYSAPKEKIDELLEIDDALQYAGVYFLLSKDMVYVGQSINLSSRISQHLKKKDWWQSVVILTTTDDSFTRSDIDYIESTFIEKANKLGRLDVENKNKGNTIKVDKYTRVKLDNYINESLFLLDLVGIDIFNEKQIRNSNSATVSINLADKYALMPLGKGAKADTLSYLKNEKNLALGNKTSYATLQKDKNSFWINPKVNRLSEDWYIVLNNVDKRELTVILVPANSLVLKSSEHSGLLTRKDVAHSNEIDLNLDANSLVDLRSKIDFSKFVIHKISY